MSKIRDIIWYSGFREDRLDSAWYGGDTVSMKYKHYYITIAAYGDIRAIIKGVTYADKGSMGEFKNYLEENGINNDEELQEAIEKGDVEFLDNNWFEIIVWDNKKKDYLLSWDDVVDLKPDDDFSWVKDYIEEVEEE